MPPHRQRALLLAGLIWALALAACDDVRYSSATVTTIDWPDGDPPDGDDLVDDLPDGDLPDTPPDDPPLTDLEFSEPITAIDRGVQVFPQIVWTGQRFALVWVQNFEGHLFATATFIDPQTLEIGPTVRVSPDYTDAANSVQTVHAAASGGSVTVVWNTEGQLWFRELGDTGQPRNSPRLLTAEASPHGNVLGVLGSPSQGLGVVWQDDRDEEFHYLPRFTAYGSIDVPEHRLLVEGETNVRIGSVTLDGPDGAIMSWQRADGPGPPDQIWLTRFDLGGALRDPPELAYEGDTVHLAYQGDALVVDARGPLVGVWDVDRGAMLARPVEGGVLINDLPGGVDRPVIALAPDDSLAAVVKGTQQGIDAVWLHRFGPLDERLGEPLEVPGSARRSLFGVGIAAGGGGFGVVYDDNGSVRFVMLRVR